MDKLKLAHDWYMKHSESSSFMDAEVEQAWQYADAMQAEAKEREDKTRPEVLLTKDKDGKCLHFHHEFGHKKCMDCGASLEDWQPDWSKAPETAIAWKMQSKSNAVWIHNKSLSAFEYSIAPSFNYQGNWQDSLRKRPESLCKVDWSQAPEDAIGWMIFDGVSTWLGESGYLIEDAPSFGFTGTHILEHPHGF